MAINHKVFHPLHYVILINIGIVRSSQINILHQCAPRNLIILFKWLIVFRFHLITVIGKMNKFTVIIQWIFIRACSNITWFVEIEVIVIVNYSKDTDVEFPTLIKHWFFYVFLENETITFLILKGIYKFFERRNYFYAPTLIFIFWLQNPQIFLKLLGRKCKLRELPLFQFLKNPFYFFHFFTSKITIARYNIT